MQQRQTFLSQKQYAIILDILGVVVFAVIGRASHHESLMPREVLHTAWPFLTALLVAWAVMLLRRREHLSIGAGVYVWLTTWAGGLALRVLGDDTAAVPFIIVAGIALAVLLVGWRVLVRVLGPKQPPAPAEAPGVDAPATEG